MENDNGFGLTDQDLKNQKTKNLLLTIRNFLELIGPTVIRWFKIVLYYIIKFVRSVVVSAIKMALGKDI